MSSLEASCRETTGELAFIQYDHDTRLTEFEALQIH
jgi:hypothetical protein